MSRTKEQQLAYEIELAEREREHLRHTYDGSPTHGFHAGTLQACLRAIAALEGELNVPQEQRYQIRGA